MRARERNTQRNESWSACFFPWTRTLGTARLPSLAHDPDLSSREEKTSIARHPPSAQRTDCNRQVSGFRVNAFATAFPDEDIRWRDRANTLRSQLRGQPRFM